MIYRDTIHAETTVLQYLESFFLSKKTIQRIFASGWFVSRHAICVPDTPLKPDDDIAIDLTFSEGPSFLATHQSVSVLYEDDDLLVVSKPAGQIIYPDNPSGTGTLVNDLLGYYEQVGLPGPVRYLHRLDQDTTGCFLVAKHLLAHSYLTAKWNHVDVRRTYLCVAQGTFSSKTGRIDWPIGRDRHKNAYRVSRSGEPALTEYRVLTQSAGASLVELTLRTGRTHQIRVHLSHLGHPILGDRLYGGAAIVGLLALHSHRIAFPHPRTGQTIEIVDPMPDRYRTLLS